MAAVAGRLIGSRDFLADISTRSSTDIDCLLILIACKGYDLGLGLFEISPQVSDVVCQIESKCIFHLVGSSVLKIGL